MTSVSDFCNTNPLVFLMLLRIVTLSSKPTDKNSSEVGLNLYVLAGHENTY